MLSPPFVPAAYSWPANSCSPSVLAGYLIASTRAMPSPRQCPVPTTTIWVGGLDISISTPEESPGGNRLPREDRQRRQTKSQRELVSMVWPNRVPGRAHHEIRMLGEEGAFFRGRGLGAGGAGDDGPAALGRADLRPQLSSVAVTSPGCLRWL